MAQTVKCLSANNAGDLGSIPGSGRSPGEGNGNPLQFLAWKIPWMEEPGRLQSMGAPRVWHNWATSLTHYISFKEGFNNATNTSQFLLLLFNLVGCLTFVIFTLATLLILLLFYFLTYFLANATLLTGSSYYISGSGRDISLKFLPWLF